MLTGDKEIDIILSNKKQVTEQKYLRTKLYDTVPKRKSFRATLETVWPSVHEKEQMCRAKDVDRVTCF